ncbi:hypothetical protein [Lederbergia graminis]|uniref:Uncharacterized protein n=1 Tax=Lederbergia graminis TaxID=735518 RepID=A0ABW0LI67_9BACI
MAKRSVFYVILGICLVAVTIGLFLCFSPKKVRNTSTETTTLEEESADTDNDDQTPEIPPHKVTLEEVSGDGFVIQV